MTLLLQIERVDFVTLCIILYRKEILSPHKTPLSLFAIIILLPKNRVDFYDHG